MKRAASESSELTDEELVKDEVVLEQAIAGPSSSPAPRKAVEPNSSPSKAKRRRKHVSMYKDEFQQVSNPKFVDRYRIRDMGYGGDVYYKADVSVPMTAPLLGQPR